MLVNEILNTDISPLHLEDSVATALMKIDLLHTTKFAVVDSNDRVVGMASLEKLIEVVDEEAPLSEIELDDPVYVPHNQHLFEASRIMLAQELFILPVTTESMEFQGMIKKRDVLSALGDIFNLSSFGSVITVELDQVDFSLSDLVRIIELEGAKILGIAVQQPNAKNPSYRVSFKLNLEDSSVVSAGLRRFGYTITSEANSEVLEGNFSDRADELIRYLDI
ncbi:MAG: CBS domain-containing protein [Balneola sp.]|jgi:CBS-domain-containing membrane protein|nr:CBS domain-containing protein [Balneola sp.]MBE80853.1 CBS domain-containing protein [Balneola sp.]HBX66345.1 CBS domain-containing protein [Balneolaceae bacterium]|tara:strand:+ start:727 stop:1392 length:666 start_codon:yes stop_codon:yes gene_type:complete